MNVEQTEERSHSKVSYRLTGDFEAVVKAARALMDRYPYAGYMTRIRDLSPASVAEPSGGRWQCVVERMASCD